MSSTLWTVTRIGLDQVFSFVVFAVVARLLGPIEVGLFALGMIVSELGRIFSTSGFADVVTKARADEEEAVALAAFWANLGLSIACALLLTVLAVPISRLLNSPRLAEIIVALVWIIPISAASAIHMARQLKRFGHKSLAIRSLISGLIGGAVAVAAAYAGAGVWSLVIQRAVTEIITLATIWMSFRWVPRLSFSWPVMKEIFPFSAQMSLAKLMNVMITRFQDVIIGVYVSLAGVGIYRVAKRSFDMLATATLTPFSTVAVNLFAAVRDEPPRMKAAVLRVVALSATAAFPIFFGVAAVAGDLVPFIYGPKWHDSVIMLQLLVPVCVPMLFSLLSLSVLTIYGQSRAVTLMTTIQMILTVALGLIAAPFGIEAVILSFLARVYALMPYQLWLVARHVGCRRRELIGAMGRPLLGSLIMAATCYGVLHELALVTDWRLARLAFTGAIGAIVYGGILWAIDRQSVLWLVEALGTYARRRPA